MKFTITKLSFVIKPLAFRITRAENCTVITIKSEEVLEKLKTSTFRGSYLGHLYTSTDPQKIWCEILFKTMWIGRPHVASIESHQRG